MKNTLLPLPRMKLELYDCPYIPLKEYDLPIKKRRKKKTFLALNLVYL
jgi:hypothetical protein